MAMAKKKTDAPQAVPAAPTFTPDDVRRFDMDPKTAVLRTNLAGARWENSSTRIKEAEAALLAHASEMLRWDFEGRMKPENRSKLIEKFSKPFGT